MFGPRLRGLFNEISTNTTSLIDSLRAACLTRTSIIFKVCCFAAILASLCAVVAHGTVTLLVLPSLTQQNLTIPLVVSHAIDVPWSADQNLAPLNVGLIGAAQLGASWTYLERVVGASVGDSVPQGYLVPLRTSSNNTVGSQYPTDVAHVQCECSWEAPTLPPATNESYIQVSLERLGITGIQTGPHGMACKCLRSAFHAGSHCATPHSICANFEHDLHIQLYTGHDRPIRLDSVVREFIPAVCGYVYQVPIQGRWPWRSCESRFCDNHQSVNSVGLRLFWRFCAATHAVPHRRWQEIITSQTGPAFIKAHPADAPFATNLTQVATLVCDPHIQIIPQFARAFGGIVDLASAPAGYSAGVGNMDRGYVSFMVYNYAAQQALDILGIFRPYIVFGEATGNAVLTSDPNNSAGGTVPKPTLEIAQTLVSQCSGNQLVNRRKLNTTLGYIYWNGKQILDGPGPDGSKHNDCQWSDYPAVPYHHGCTSASACGWNLIFTVGFRGLCCQCSHTRGPFHPCGLVDHALQASRFAFNFSQRP